MRVWLWRDALPFMITAVRAYGQQVLAAPGPAGPEEPEDLGWQLFQLVFGGEAAGADLTGALAMLIARPDDGEPQEVLAGLVRDALTEQPERQAAVLDALAACCRRQAAAGNARALAELGELLYREEDYEGARAAYRQAIDAGYPGALIDLAFLLHVTGDDDGAQDCLQRAVGTGNPDIAAQALVMLGQVLERRDPAAAQAALQQAIGTGHPDWAPAALSDLGDLRRRQGDLDGARAAYEQVIESPNAEWAGEACFSLAVMLGENGDAAGARAAFQRVFDMGHEHWGGPALRALLDQLEREDDLDGVRALHRAAAGAGNREAPYALVVQGRLLARRGDTAGAWAACQQALAADAEDADGLLEMLSPSAGPDEAELAALPPQFSRRNLVRTGLEVLAHGLPALPEVLTYQMTIPVAYWTAESCAVVLFLGFSRHGRRIMPHTVQVTYARSGEDWIPHRPFAGTGFSHDPIASPGDRRDLGGLAMVQGGASGAAQQPAAGYPAIVLTGRASPAVTSIALIQDGREDRRPLESHFGAWVICTGEQLPVQVQGLDESGRVLATIDYPFPHPGR